MPNSPFKRRSRTIRYSFLDSVIVSILNMYGLSIEIISRKATAQQRKKAEAGYAIVDVTSKSPTHFVKFSPFYPIGPLNVPGTNGLTTVSVEGAWQGLKVFEN